MLPKTHIIFGLIFSFLIYLSINLTFSQTLLVFLSSVLIDIDHYLFYLFRKKNLSLKKAYIWHKNIPKTRKPTLHLLHTVEFLVLIFILTYFWQGFLFILIGMLFHSIFDILEFIYYKSPEAREFFLIKYLVSDKNKYF